MTNAIAELEIELEKNLEKFKHSQDEHINSIVPDGIVNVTKYLNNDLKILWVLKEANSPDNCDWDMREALDSYLKTEKGLRYGWANTFTPIVYTTNGILRNEDWDTMGDFTKDPDIIDCLQEVAYINIKKIPGGSVANNDVIQKYYDDNKEALHEQIKLINPNVVIFGNTMNFIEKDFFTEAFGDLDENKENPHLHIYKNNNRLLLHAYHPNNRVVKHKEYCNSIIEAVKLWKQN